MGRRGILVAIGGLALAAGIAAYFLALPPVLADGFEDRAEPEHRRVARTLQRVYGSLGSATFSTSFDDFEADGHAYVRAIRRAAVRDARALRLAKRAVRRARLELARVDDEAMTDGPSWPLLGGVGDAGRANDVADQERTYLKKARAFVRDFVDLLDYRGKELRLTRLASVVLARLAVRVPSSVADELAYIASVRARLELWVRPFEVELPPEPVRDQHKHQVEETNRVIRGLRVLERALPRVGLDRALKLYNRAIVPSDRYLSRQYKDLDRLLERSQYARGREDLRVRHAEIQRAYLDL
ncbi:MAG: hypothetical protein M3340_07035 [Actinomycetota bacterium]|nr:hypothetical protein [Actinomycetota bacterium]